MDEDMSVFKSYLRRLLQDLKDLKEVLKAKDYEKAEKMVDRLIDDTQKGIEDNQATSNKGRRKSRPVTTNKIKKRRMNHEKYMCKRVWERNQLCSS